MGKAENHLFFRSSVIPVEVRAASGVSFCYQKHTHEEFSVGVVDSGLSEFYYAGKKELVGSGSTVLVNPGDVHSCNPRGGGKWGFKMAYMEAGWFYKILGDVLGVRPDVQMLLSKNHLYMPSVYRSFNLMFSLIVLERSHLSIEQSVIEFIAGMAKLGGLNPDVVSVRDDQAVMRAREFIEDYCERNIRLIDVANAVGLSGYHLIRMFRMKYGITPHAYQLVVRINRAKTMLRRGERISSVAARLGFSDQSHFHRNFKRIVAATPKQYKDSF